jgi:hypothetical protein
MDMMLINKCLKLSRDAYNDDKSYQCGNEAYVVYKEDDTIYVSFRGSDDLKDWLENVDIGFNSQNGVLVHSGFFKSLKECLPTLCSFISRNYSYGDKFVLTGHSKGSAMALLVGNDLISKGFPSNAIQFVGFATPRVIKASSVALFGRHRFNILLCELEGDPVTDLPKRYMGYSKVYDILKVRRMVWWRRIFGVRAYNHKMSEYVKRFYVKENLIVTKFKTIRARMSVRG